MRKTRRLTLDELAPYCWEVPRRPIAESSDVQGAPTAGPPTDARLVLIDWLELFGNSNPVEIEVGMGKGQFLLNSAMTRPEVNFFGIEIVRKYQLYSATRFAIRKLPNVKTACADAKVILRDHIATGSVSAIHVYFPDPWWKKRHRKRRVFTEEFAGLVARALRPGGRLHIATDVEEYFGVMMAIVRGHGSLRALPPPEERPPSHDMDYLTNFERKARKQGLTIHRAIFERVEGS